jgi:hypothetical protein
MLSPAMMLFKPALLSYRSKPVTVTVLAKRRKSKLAA